MTARVLPLRQVMTIAEAAEAFLARPMSETTRRSYAQTMARLGALHGDLAVPALDGATLDSFAVATWGACAPATWNRHVATLRSFTAHARRRGWTVGVPLNVYRSVADGQYRPRAHLLASRPLRAIINLL